MKAGLTLTEMASEIERLSKLKEDYLVDTRCMKLEPCGSDLTMIGCRLKIRICWPRTSTPGLSRNRPNDWSARWEARQERF